MKKTVFLSTTIVFLLGIMIQIASAQKTVTFTATINPGALLTDVRNEFGQSVVNPNLDLGRVINSMKCRHGNSAISGVFGDNAERIYVDNPKAAFDGWTLTIAPKYGDATRWSSENDEYFDFNDAGFSGNGCTDGDNDGYGGLLSIDPSDARLASDCLNCSTKDIILGSNSSKSFAEADNITLLRANDQSDTVGSWYLTGIKINQTIPSAQDGGSYSLEMILTATAS